MFKTIASVLKNKEIRNRILFTLAILFIFRFGAALTVPGINPDAVANIENNSLFDMINLLGGGGLEQLSVFSLGVGPYITASIIIQLLSMDVIPHFTELSKQGAQGRKVLDKYTRYLSIILGFVQAFTLMYGFSQSTPNLIDANNLWANILFISTVLVAGSMFVLWLGDRITARGIGNGQSMIIAAGIIADLPFQLTQAWTAMVDTSSSAAAFNGVLSVAGYILCYIVIIVFVVIISTAERKIPIQYTSSTVSTKRKDMNYLPLKINSASVIPVIFASSIMVAPLSIIKMLTAADWVTKLEYFLGMRNAVSLGIYVVLIILFTFFYTELQVNPEQIAENLGKSGTYIPGVRPGKETKEYITKVLNRITVLGALALAAVAVLPHALPLFTSLPASLGIGGTGIIIVVGVALETVNQIKGRMTQRSYTGFKKLGSKGSKYFH